MFGFLGPNGAGKSTTMRLLLADQAHVGLGLACSGWTAVEDSLEIRRRVGFLPGDLALYPRLTGLRCSITWPTLRGGVENRVRDALIERFDADLDRPVRELSTGNRQKLGLIQAFMHEPELLILDEPIAGLDPTGPAQLPHAAARGSATGPNGSAVVAHAVVRSSGSQIGSRSSVAAGWSSSIRSRICAASRRSGWRSSSRRRWQPRSSARCPASSRAVAEGTVVTVSFEGSADARGQTAATHEVARGPST